MNKVRQSEVRTDLSSASLVGAGHVPGSSVIARKKLYAHRPNDKAKMRWANACDSVSINRVLGEQGPSGGGTHVAIAVLPKHTQPRPSSQK